MRFISRGETTSRERIDTHILPLVLSYYRPWPPQGFWIAHRRQDDDFIGWFHLRPDKFTPGDMELGYRLKRAAWGCGLATEGARAVVEHALGPWGYPRVSARTLSLNRPSQRVMEKAGLKFESHFLWPQPMMPEWTEEERRGVKYAKPEHNHQRWSGSDSRVHPGTAS